MWFSHILHNCMMKDFFKQINEVDNEIFPMFKEAVKDFAIAGVLGLVFIVLTILLCL